MSPPTATVSRGYTGRARYRIVRRLFRRPRVELQLEERIAFMQCRDEKGTGTRWVDAEWAWRYCALSE